MNAKNLVKLGGTALGAGSAVRSFSKARNQQDKLRMLDAVVTLLSVAVTVAIIVREMRESRDGKSRVVELEDDK